MEDLLNNQKSISFSGYGASRQNGESEHVIKTVFTMKSTMLIHTTLICPEETFSTDLWPMKMNYDVWVYNWIPYVQYGLSAIKICSRSRFEPLSETLTNYSFWGFPTYILEPKLQNPGVKIPKWAPRIRRGFNMGFSKMNSTQFGLVLNLLTGSILPQCHVVFYDMFYYVVSSTSTDTEVWVSLVTLSNSRIQVILDQEDDPELYN